MDQSSSGGRKGSSNNNNNRNRNRSGNNQNRRNDGGGQNRDRDQNRNRNSREQSRRPEPKKKEGVGAKILRFFGFGKKDEPKSSQQQSQSNRSSSTKKRVRKPAEIAEPTSGRLYVGNLDYGITESELSDFFGKAGKVVSASIITNPHNGRSKGFAFVEMSSIDEAKEAVKSLQNNEINGRQILVSGAKSKPTRDREPRRQQGDRPPRRDGPSGDRRSGGNDRSRNDRNKGRKRYDEDPPVERKPRKVETVTTSVLKVGNLIGEATEEDVREAFRDISALTSVKMAGDAESDEKGTAQVEFATVEEAQNALNILHGKNFMGQDLSLTGVSA